MSRYKEWLPTPTSSETVSPQTEQQWEPIELPNGMLNPQYIESAFAVVMQEYVAARHPGHKPNRVQRIQELFRNRQYQSLTLNELSEPFAGLSNPNEVAQSTLSWINRTFIRLGLEIEIDRFTSYRIRRCSRE